MKKQKNKINQIFIDEFFIWFLKQPSLFIGTNEQYFKSYIKLEKSCEKKWYTLKKCYIAFKKLHTSTKSIDKHEI